MSEAKAKTGFRFGPKARFAAAALPAALMTGGIFLAMQHLITVDEVEFDKPATYTLSDFRPKIETTEVRTTDRNPAERMESKSPPPPPDFQKPETDAPSIGEIYEVGKAPVVTIEPVVLPSTPTVFVNRKITPIRPPVPVYPNTSLEGSCEVRFSIDTRGKPFDVEATCTDRVFVSSAERAMRKVEFAPEIRGGVPVVRENVVYPLVYELEE